MAFAPTASWTPSLDCWPRDRNAVAQQPPALDSPGAPLTKPVCNLALILIRQPVA